MNATNLDVAIVFSVIFFFMFSFVVYRLPVQRPWKWALVVLVGGALAVWMVTGLYLYAYLNKP